jgi:hypothetical protein
MALGKLVQVNKVTVTSAVASQTMTGIDSDDVYLLICNSVIPSTSGADLQMRVTESGTAISTAHYYWANVATFANAVNSTSYSASNTVFDLSGSISSSTGHNLNNFMYIYNANNSSEYTFFSYHQIYPNTNDDAQGQQGGGAFAKTSAVNGFQFYMDTGNIASAEFILYKVV